MMSVAVVFWVFVVMFSIIGGFRGWAKEILVSFAMLLAIAIDVVLTTYVDAVKTLVINQPGATSLILRASLLLALAYFGYQTPGLPASVTGKLAKDKLQDWMLGAILGALNGYLIVGSIWFYMHNAGYPLPYVTPPTDPETLRLVTYMAPGVLGIPTIYFVVIAAFVFVIIVFV